MYKQQIHAIYFIDDSHSLVLLNEKTIMKIGPVEQNNVQLMLGAFIVFEVSDQLMRHGSFVSNRIICLITP